MSRRSSIQHLLNWSVLSIIMIYIFYPSGLPAQTILLLILLRTISFAVIYYAFFLFIAHDISEGHYLRYVLKLIIAYILFFILFYLIDLKLIGFLYKSDRYTLNWSWCVNTSLVYLLISFMSYGFYKKNESILVLSKLAIEEQLHLKRQIFFMRNQFNHHISFNFLNHCYSNMQRDSKGAKMIELYSDMLRYTLDSKPLELVHLKREVDYIHQYIALNKLLDSRLNVQFTILGTIGNRMILPRVLITFVENAIKHGVIYDPIAPVNIVLDCKRNELDFVVENKKQGGTHGRISKGIGYNNAKAQLDLYYKAQYELNVDETHDRYICRLILNA
jgi:two-component system, LytTR family, sensor kinase